MNDSGAGVVCTLSNDTFTTKTGALVVGLNAMTPATVTGCKFNVAGTSWGISAAANVTVTGSTFTGVAETTDTYLGNGISITGGTGNAISTSTFTGLTNALTVNGGTAMANFFNNTVTNCGEASPPALTATDQTTSAIIITAAAANGVNIYGNTITAGTYYVLSVATGNDSSVNFYQNTLTGNAEVASNDDLNNTLMLTKNWWGGAANVPANVKLVAGTTAGLTFAPALGAAPSATAFAVSGSLSASATVGVNVSDSGDAAYEIGATALAGNPTSIAIPSADTATKYFDVYGQTPAGGNLTGATIDFYGTTAIPVVNTPTSVSAVLFYNSTTGAWVNAGGMVNAFGNYVEIYVGSVNGSTLSSVVTPAQFNGTPFVLVTQTIPLGGIVPPTATPIFPANGATGVPINNLTFTWPAVSASGLTVTYQFALAQASANTSANWFAILDYSDNTTTNAEPSQEVLQPNTVYWWEVRAVTMNSSGGIAATGPWSIQMFTTAPAVTATTSSAAVTITQTNTSVIVTQPITTVQSTVTSVVITQTTGTSTQAIPSYLLWAVIVVGAILVIAVIILIVRTRRIP